MECWTKLREQGRTELALLALRARCRTDRRLFARYYFAEKLCDDRTEQPIPFSRAHLALLDAPKPGYRERAPGEGWRRAWMLPRGNGKTTVALRIELCHDIVYELERYIVILAESASLARARVFEIATELENNLRLRRDFGNLVGEDIWQRATGYIITGNGVTLVAKSMESQVRGLLHPQTNSRPTKICMDDAEDSQDVRNPELRARDRRRMTQDIEPAAAVNGTTCFQITGTPLHREALLPSFASNPSWEFRAYPAIVRWPERMDLWERCRALWTAAGAPDPDAPEDPNRESARKVAERFYLANRAEMDRGAQVLWPEHEPLFQLMVWRWTNGESAFAQEKLLVPRDPSLATFDMERAVRTEVRADHLIVREAGGTLRRVEFGDLFRVSFHDPCGADPSATRGKARLGDYAAIVTVGIERTKTGTRFGHILGAWMSQRAPVSQQIEAAFQIGERFRVQRHVLESDTLDLLRAAYRVQQSERQRKSAYWQLPLMELEAQTTSKDARISTLEPAVTNGWLTFPVDLSPDFMNQWVDHPTGDHDDGPDATEGAWRCGSRRPAGLRLVTPAQ